MLWSSSSRVTQSLALCAAGMVSIVAAISTGNAGAANPDYCKQGTVTKAVFETFFAAMSTGNVPRARALVGSPPEFISNPLGKPVHGRLMFTVMLRRTPKVLRKEVVLIDVPRNRDKWLRQHAGERFSMTDWTVAKKPERYQFAGLSFLREGEGVPGGSLEYGAKGGVDCKRRRIIALGAGANYFP